MKKVLINAVFVGEQKPAEAELRYYAPQEALLSGLKAGAICWVVALICILVPVLHFVLTPAAFIAGPVAGLLVFFRKQKLPSYLNGKVICGHCKNPTTFHFEHIKPPFYASCETCKTGYELLWPPIKEVHE